jgi:archaellum component FlaC
MSYSDVRAVLQDNSGRLSAKAEPVEWNLQVAVEKLLMQVESDTRSLESKLSSIQKQLKEALDRVETLERRVKKLQPAPPKQ